MAKGVRAPGVALGVACRKCGGDEWRYRPKGKGRVRVCVFCARLLARTHKKAEWDQLGAAERLWHGARKRTARRGESFALTPDDIRAVWPKDGRCPVLGVLMHAGDNAPSLDRINNAWSYEKGNIAVISVRANKIKRDATASELEAIAAWMRSTGLS